MGLRTSSAVFQNLMNKIYSGLQGVEIPIYMDDAIMYSITLEEHMQKIFVKIMMAAKLLLKPSKCNVLC